MKKKMKILAVIPARGSSQRLPGKNIRPLAGKPLIAYAIEAALVSGVFSRVIVSTNDEKIAKVARHHGAEVPFLRPAELATHTADPFLAFRHALVTIETIDKNLYDVAVLMQATTPLVLADDIKAVINQLNETGANSCVSVCEITERPEWMYSFDNGLAKPFSTLHNVTSRSQDLAKAYRLNGAIYASRRHVILEQNKLLDHDNLSLVIMPKERSIDIDELIDFQIAELMMQQMQND